MADHEAEISAARDRKPAEAKARGKAQREQVRLPTVARSEETCYHEGQPRRRIATNKSADLPNNKYFLSIVVILVANSFFQPLSKNTKKGKTIQCV